jgi:hypothetical protein
MLQLTIVLKITFAACLTRRTFRSLPKSASGGHHTPTALLPLDDLPIKEAGIDPQSHTLSRHDLLDSSDRYTWDVGGRQP